MKRKNLVGQRFNALLVVSMAGTKNNRVLWNCKCDCGNTVVVDTHSLMTNNTKSCGCKKYGNRETHGEAKSGHQTRLYRIWSGMKNRCNNESHIGYAHYGAKGIKVCDKWRDYNEFKKWAFANGYDDKLTIDRIDNQKGYSPENCRWVTNKIQSNNTTRNHYVTVGNETLTISQWADRYNIPCRTIAARLNQLGWSPKEAVMTPIRGLYHAR